MAVKRSASKKRVSANRSSNKIVAVAPPRLERPMWIICIGLAALLLLAAIMQLLDFNEFADKLAAFGVPEGAFWPAVVIGAELWAIACLLPVRLSTLFRQVSASLMVAVAGFWFLLAVTGLSNGTAEQCMGTFGNGMHVPSNWLTTLLSAVALGGALYLFPRVSGRRV